MSAASSRSRGRGQAHTQGRQAAAQRGVDLGGGSSPVGAGQGAQHGGGVAASLLFHLPRHADPGGSRARRARARPGRRRHRRGTWWRSWWCSRCVCPCDPAPGCRTHVRDTIARRRPRRPRHAGTANLLPAPHRLTDRMPIFGERHLHRGPCRVCGARQRTVAHRTVQLRPPCPDRPSRRLDTPRVSQSLLIKYQRPRCEDGPGFLWGGPLKAWTPKSGGDEDKAELDGHVVVGGLGLRGAPAGSVAGHVIDAMSVPCVPGGDDAETDQPERHSSFHGATCAIACGVPRGGTRC